MGALTSLQLPTHPHMPPHPTTAHPSPTDSICDITETVQKRISYEMTPILLH